MSRMIEVAQRRIYREQTRYLVWQSHLDVMRRGEKRMKNYKGVLWRKKNV